MDDMHAPEQAGNRGRPVVVRAYPPLTHSKSEAIARLGLGETAGAKVLAHIPSVTLPGMTERRWLEMDLVSYLLGLREGG